MNIIYEKKIHVIDRGNKKNFIIEEETTTTTASDGLARDHVYGVVHSAICMRTAHWHLSTRCINQEFRLPLGPRGDGRVSLGFRWKRLLFLFVFDKQKRLLFLTVESSAGVARSLPHRKTNLPRRGPNKIADVGLKMGRREEAQVSTVSRQVHS